MGLSDTYKIYMGFNHSFWGGGGCFGTFEGRGGGGTIPELKPPGTGGFIGLGP